MLARALLALGLVGAGVGVVASPAAAVGTCFGETPTIVGTNFDDDLQGTNERDVILAGEGIDTVHGNGGPDLICGGPGNDVIFGGKGGDTIDGEGDSDQISGEGGNDELFQAAGDVGLAGSGVLSGGTGHDILHGSTGNDTLRAGLGSDTIEGDSGTDVLSTAFGAGATIDMSNRSATDGVDTDTWTGMETVGGSIHADRFIMSALVETVNGYDGNDRFESVGDGDAVVMGKGSNVALLVDGIPASVNGKQGSDTVDLSARTTGAVVLNMKKLDGSDVFIDIETLIGTPLDDDLDSDGAGTIDGGAGDDTISSATTALAGEGNDVIVETLTAFGEAGNDTISGATTARGGPGNDDVTGQCGPSTLYGDADDDVIRGAPSSCTTALDADYIRGNDGVDMLFGLVGDDTIVAKDGVAGDSVDGGPDDPVGIGDTCTFDPGDSVVNCEH